LRKATQDQAVLAYAEKNILFVEKAPHEWLFPQVSCAVHHGGQGTLNASARAGIPTIITPVWGDQWDTAYIVNQHGIGIGMPKQFQKTTATELGDAIKTVITSDEIKAKAKSIGEKLRAEDGVKNMVGNVQAFWAEWVQTGKYSDIVGNYLKEASVPARWWSCMAGRSEMNLQEQEALILES